MAVLVTGGAGFIGSHVAEALVARGDDVVVLDDLSTGKRENVPEGAELVEGDIREPQDELFAARQARRSASTSPRRPTSASRSSGPSTTRGSTSSARSTCSRRRSSTTRGSSSAPPAGRSTASASARRPRTHRGGRSRRTGRRSSRARSTWRPTTGCTGRGTSRCATATSTGRGRTRTARPASSRSSSSRLPERGAAEDLRRREPDARLRVRRATSCARRWPRPSSDGGVFNVGTGRETSVVELYELCRRVAGKEDVEAGVRAAASGRAPAERARHQPRGRRARLAAGAQPRGRPPRDLGVDEPVGKERRGRRRITFGPWRSRPQPPASSTGAPRRSSRAASPPSSSSCS